MRQIIEAVVHPVATFHSRFSSETVRNEKSVAYFTASLQMHVIGIWTGNERLIRRADRLQRASEIVNKDQ